jgi:hypothetical protein
MRIKSSNDASSIQLYNRIFPFEEEFVKNENIWCIKESIFRKLAAGTLVFVGDDLSSFKSVSTELNPIDACQLQDVRVGTRIDLQGTLVKKGSRLRKVIDSRLAYIFK